jgi:C-terminal processing protease CtpA/Prc
VQIVPNGAAARCAQIWVGDILSTIDDRHVTSIAEAKQLILGDEGTYVTLGLQRPSIGEFTLRIARGTTASATPPKASPSATSSSRPAAGDYGSWSVKELKQALSEAGINHSWANEKSDLVSLATENKVPPPGTPRPSSQGGSGRSGADLFH